VVDLTYSPYDYAVHEDPYPIYARLRDEAPVYRNDEVDFWALSRHEDVMDAFRDSDRFSSRYGVSIDPAAWGPRAEQSASFLAMDPPRHGRMRSLVARGFTPRRVLELEPRIREIARQHLDVACDRAEFDFIADFAGLLPMDVVSELIGVPVADRAELRRLSDLLLHRDEGVADVPPAAAEAGILLAVYYADMVASRRRAPTDDLTSALLRADIDGDRLSDEEVTGFLILMGIAGNETTTKLLGNAWYWAWRHPDERARPFGDARWVPNWVEETLRFDTSSQALARLVVEDVALHGMTIPVGARVLLLAGAANRDPRAFPDADRYVLDRPDSEFQRIASFGFGRHFCLGASLARLEARICLEELVDRIADYEIDVENAARVHSANVRGFAALPTSTTRR
jgi:cytochrome P450